MINKDINKEVDNESTESEESCLEKAQELLDHCKADNCPEDVIELMNEVVGKLEQEEPESEDESDYDKMDAKTMGDHMKKRGLIIGIEIKKK